jgi:putative flippase GtrA
MRSVSDNQEANLGRSSVEPEPVVIVTDGDTVTEPTGWMAGLRRSPLVRRVTGYSAGSVIAAFTSELAFAGVYGWLHAGTTWSSLAGFIGGAVPNYILNRRWAWQDRKGRSRRQEITLYAAVSIASFLVSILVTNAAEHWAKHLTSAHNLRVLLVAAAYLAVSGVFFVGKFVAYELLVFTKGPAVVEGAADAEGLAGPVVTDGSLVAKGPNGSVAPEGPGRRAHHVVSTTRAKRAP